MRWPLVLPCWRSRPGWFPSVSLPDTGMRADGAGTYAVAACAGSAAVGGRGATPGRPPCSDITLKPGLFGREQVRVVAFPALQAAGTQPVAHDVHTVRFTQQVGTTEPEAAAVLVRRTGCPSAQKRQA